MNLCLLDFKSIDNYPCVIHEDFIDVSTGFGYKGYFLNESKTFTVKNIDNRLKEVKLPLFDACVGNPPYIRQELISRKNDWNKAAEKEWGLKKINQQSDLYVYYLMHTAAFLTEGGRLGYVISSSWLDVAFGTGLQKFLLDNFKIITVIDHQKKRSFETASVNTVILILEKCSSRELREANTVRFIRFYADYEKFIGNSQDQDRFERVNAFTQKIENTNKETKNDDFWLIPVNQKTLQQNSTHTSKYQNGNWGAMYHRAPEIFYKLLKAGRSKWLNIDDVVDVKYGIKTGANPFFYLTDDTEKALKMSDDDYKVNFGVTKSKHINVWNTCGWYYSPMTKSHHLIENQFVKPFFKSQRESENMSINLKSLKNVVLFCQNNKNRLANFKHKILAYIQKAEQKPYEIDKVPSVQARELWYDVSDAAVIGDFIFPSMIYEKYATIDNRQAQVLCDNVNYAITVKEDFIDEKDIVFALMNSMTFRFYLHLFARQMAEGLTDIDIVTLKNALILNPNLLKSKIKDIREIIKKLKSREQETIYEEIKQKERIELDTLIFEAIGLNGNDVKELYKELENYLIQKISKSKSVKTAKTKQNLTYDESLQFIIERFPDIQNYASLLRGKVIKAFNVPLQKAKYPKDDGISLSMFQDFNVYFPQGNKQTILKLENKAQVKLFKFFNETLEHKGEALKLPTDEVNCQDILKLLQSDFDDNLADITHLLKTHRSKANPLSIYKDLILK